MIADTQSLTVRVPLAIQQRGGRKLVVTPEGEPASTSVPRRARVDSTLVKALARAQRWKRLLEEGRYASITELAQEEKSTAVRRSHPASDATRARHHRSDSGRTAAGGPRAAAADEALSGDLERTARMLGKSFLSIDVTQ
jgi:hypothetical protein